MNDFDKNLGDALRSGEEINSTRAEAIKLEAMEMYDEKLKFARNITWLAHILFVLVILGGLLTLQSVSLNYAMFLLAIVLIADSGLVVMKLWYWTVNTKLSVLKEVAELRAQIASLEEKLQSRAE